MIIQIGIYLEEEEIFSEGRLYDTVSVVSYLEMAMI